MRLAAVADLHCSRHAHGELQALFARMAEEADVLLLGGDLTDYGTPNEARLLAAELKAASARPVLAVLGNHDYESGQQHAVKDILREAGVHVLDGDGWEADGIGVAGVKGFLGGFGARMLQSWGEATIKALVREDMEESLKLETALARLSAPVQVVLLHYSPVRTTVEGEPPEIIPFLGSSRLEEPLHRHPVAAVFHGHAHHGTPEGFTSNGIPVFNVSLPLLKRRHPGLAPFKTFEVKLDPAARS
ncbi:MAG TPA: metallophosphoesterase [Planctomycetota bacterium]|nr:metallophosphoesterase [Planctomycetota bacterium]